MMCERPTASGNPCRNVLTLMTGEVACRVHANEHDEALAAAFRDLLGEQWKRAWACGKEEALRQVEVASREQRRKDRFRLTEDGRQIVKVSTGYAYVWNGEEPLEIGDRVIVPGNWLVKQAQEVEVVSFGSDYDGQFSAITRLVSRAAVAS